MDPIKNWQHHCSHLKFLNISGQKDMKNNAFQHTDTRVKALLNISILLSK